MKKYKLMHVVLSTCFLFMCQSLWAFETNSLNYWKCTTTDAENKTWTIDGNYQLNAINYSFAACKKESAYPKSCKTSKTSCEHFVNGQTTQPMWRCVALDRAAGIWPSNTYMMRDDAALAAQAYCKDNSSVPASCYINMITCRNLNVQHAMSE